MFIRIYFFTVMCTLYASFMKFQRQVYQKIWIWNFPRSKIWPKNTIFSLQPEPPNLGDRQSEDIVTKDQNSTKKVLEVLSYFTKIVLDFFTYFFRVFTMIHCILIPQLLIHPRGSRWVCSWQVPLECNNRFARDIDFLGLNKFGQKWLNIHFYGKFYCNTK